MKCINCAYHYITPVDKYSHCQFEPIADWDKAPCELWEASTHHPDVVYHMNADGKYKKSGLRSSFLLLWPGNGFNH